MARRRREIVFPESFLLPPVLSLVSLFMAHFSVTVFLPILFYVYSSVKPSIESIVDEVNREEKDRERREENRIERKTEKEEKQ